jgi:hypothetical protein
MTHNATKVSFFLSLLAIIEEVKSSLGFKVRGKSSTGKKDHYHLRENVSTFGYASLLGSKSGKQLDPGTTNTFLWREVS